MCPQDSYIIWWHPTGCGDGIEDTGCGGSNVKKGFLETQCKTGSFGISDSAGSGWEYAGAVKH